MSESQGEVKVTELGQQKSLQTSAVDRKLFSLGLGTGEGDGVLSFFLACTGRGVCPTMMIFDLAWAIRPVP